MIADHFDKGQHSTHAEAHLQCELLHAIFGLPRDPSIQALLQISHKKMAISLNAVSSEGYFGAGNDLWVEKLVGYFHKSAITAEQLVDGDRTKAIVNAKARFTLSWCRRVSPAIGRWANELGGTLGQLLRGSEEERKVGETMLEIMAKHYTEYDELIDSLVGYNNWCKDVREEEYTEANQWAIECRATTTAKSSESRKRKRERDALLESRADVMAERRKKRQINSFLRSRLALQPHTSSEPMPMSEYENARERNIERNYARLRELFPGICHENTHTR